MAKEGRFRKPDMPYFDFTRSGRRRVTTGDSLVVLTQVSFGWQASPSDPIAHAPIGRLSASYLKWEASRTA